MNNYSTILKRVGLVLIIIGVIDIAYMVWCLANLIPYSSFLNILALIAGIFLFRGNLKAAKSVRWFSAFVVGWWGLGIFVFPFLFPFDYLLARLRLRFVSTIFSIIIRLVLLGWIYWVFRELSAKSILQAQSNQGVSPTNISIPFVLGSLLSILVFGMASFVFAGDTAKEMILRAEQKYGSDYKYVLKSLEKSTSSSGKSVSAVLTAYNDEEMKDITIEWKE